MNLIKDPSKLKKVVGNKDNKFTLKELGKYFMIYQSILDRT